MCTCTLVPHTWTHACACAHTHTHSVTIKGTVNETPPTKPPVKVHSTSSHWLLSSYSCHLGVSVWQESPLPPPRCLPCAPAGACVCSPCATGTQLPWDPMCIPPPGWALLLSALLQLPPLGPCPHPSTAGRASVIEATTASPLERQEAEENRYS